MAEIERNIVNKARKIVLEGLINLRRNWETMSRHQTHEVAVGGHENLARYKQMMIYIAGSDFMDNDTDGIYNFDDTADVIDLVTLSSLTRFLLLELNPRELVDLSNTMGASIVVWTNSKLPEEERRMDDEYLKDMQLALNAQPQYMVLVLLTDLHHYTYVETAAKCLETS